MRAKLAITLLAVVMVSPLAVASDRPDGDFDFSFSFTSPPASATTIPDDNVRTFLLSEAWFRNDSILGSSIQYLELEITGLTHASPWDLNILLED